jgi:hypothetical protein
MGKGAMTLVFPADTKRCRIVNQLCGRCSRLQVHHAASNYFLFDVPRRGLDLENEIERLRRQLVRRGWEVEPGYGVEDRSVQIRAMMRS